MTHVSYEQPIKNDTFKFRRSVLKWEIEAILFFSSFIEIQHWVSSRCTVYLFDLLILWNDHHNKFS